MQTDDLITYTPSAITTLIVSFFVITYVLYLVRKLVKEHLDLYDFFMLSAVAALPFALVIIPGLPEYIAKLFGVSAAYIVMFSALLVVLFLMVHRVISRLNKLERTTRLLVQEVSTLMSKTKDQQVE